MELDKKHLCDKCFSTHGCGCEGPFGFIAVDRPLVRLIQIMNNRGMKTFSSSAGDTGNITGYVTVAGDNENMFVWLDVIKEVDSLYIKKYACHGIGKITTVDDNTNPRCRAFKLRVEFSTMVKHNAKISKEERLKVLHEYIGMITDVYTNKKIAEMLEAEKENEK